MKNTDKNEPEIEVKLDGSKNRNGWSLAGPGCMFVEFEFNDSFTIADPSGESGLCLDHAAVSSICKSLRLKLGNNPCFKN